MVWKARMLRVVVPARRASWSTVRLSAGAVRSRSVPVVGFIDLIVT